MTEKISAWQFMILTIFFGIIFTAGPYDIVLEAKQDSWIGIVMGVGMGGLLVWLYYALSLRYPAMTMVQMCERVLGRWLGNIVVLFFAIANFQFLAGNLFFNAVFTTTTILPDTPMYAIIIFTTIIIVYLMRTGIETVARAGELFFLATLLLLVIFYATISPQFEIERLQPVFQTDIKTLLRSSIMYSAGNIFPLVSMLMIIPAHLNSSKKGFVMFGFGILIAGIITILNTLLEIGVLGVDLSTLYQYPIFILAKRISVGQFFERVEIIITIIWILTTIYRIYILFYSSVQACTQLFGLPDYRPLVLPFSTIFVSLSVIENSNPQFIQRFIMYSWMPAISILAVIVPLLLLIVSSFRSSKRRTG